MITAQPIGFLNTGLPLAVLAALALGVPRLLVRRGTRAHGDIAIAMLGSVLILLVAGQLLFALLYIIAGIDVVTAFRQAPLATGGFFLRLSAFAALIWGPVLALVWLGMAQRVESLRGNDRMRKG